MHTVVVLLVVMALINGTGFVWDPCFLLETISARVIGIKMIKDSRIVLTCGRTITSTCGNTRVLKSKLWMSYILILFDSRSSWNILSVERPSLLLERNHLWTWSLVTPHITFSRWMRLLITLYSHILRVIEVCIFWVISLQIRWQNTYVVTHRTMIFRTVNILDIHKISWLLSSV